MHLIATSLRCALSAAKTQTAAPPSGQRAKQKGQLTNFCPFNPFGFGVFFMQMSQFRQFVRLVLILTHGRGGINLLWRLIVSSYKTTILQSDNIY